MAWLMMIARCCWGARIPQRCPTCWERGYLRDQRGSQTRTSGKSAERERVQCFRLATCKLSWPEHRAPVLGELLVSGSGLKCQRRRDKSVSQPSIVLAAPTQLPRYRYGFLTPLLDVLAQPVEAFLEATLLEDRAHLQM